LWHCTTSGKIAVSIPDKVIAFFIDLIFSGALWPWGLTEMNARNIFVGVKAADA
jgi:hypothetical protein